MVSSQEGFAFGFGVAIVADLADPIIRPLLTCGSAARTSIVKSHRSRTSVYFPVELHPGKFPSKLRLHGSYAIYWALARLCAIARCSRVFPKGHHALPGDSAFSLVLARRVS